MWDERYELINGHNWYRPLYYWEKRLARHRYDYVCEYIRREVRPGMTVADVGCGYGTYWEALKACGAKIYPYDIIPIEGVGYLDISKNRLPIQADLTICIGILPYIAKWYEFFKNILPYTDKLLFDFLDKWNCLNALRRAVPALNVRKVHFQSKWEIGWALTGGYPRFAHRGTGWMVEWKAGQNKAHPLF